MISLLIKLFVRPTEHTTEVNIGKSYALLSSVVGAFLNILLCTAKLIIGTLTHSVAILADGFNNFSDIGTSLVTLFGLKMAKYNAGHKHPFGHGRIEWIVGIFTSNIVLLMGIKLAETSTKAIVNPPETTFSLGVLAILVLSMFVKIYMYCYNRKFAKLTGSESLKATAVDCISDTISTGAVVISSAICYVTGTNIDGYCGIVVSLFIILSGGKTLMEIVDRIIGKKPEKGNLDTVMNCVEKHSQIKQINYLQLHDYGFGYFVVSMRVEGYRKDAALLYSAVQLITYQMKNQYGYDCIIQIDYLIEDEKAVSHIMVKLLDTLKPYKNEIEVKNLRLIEDFSLRYVAFDYLFPPKYQKVQEQISRDLAATVAAEGPQYLAIINPTLHRRHNFGHFSPSNQKS